MPLLFFWKRDIYSKNMRDPKGRITPPAQFYLHQESPRLHDVNEGDSVWAFTRNRKGTYVLAAELIVVAKDRSTSPYGSYRIMGDPTRSRHFDVDHAPSAEDVIRGLSIRANAQMLGNSFQGLQAVRTITSEDQKKLREFSEDLVIVVPGEPAEHAPSPPNPPWNRDELILALELYLSNRTSPPGKTSDEVMELSRLLNRMRGEATGLETYRNANGVYMKMMNFRRFDPQYTSDGRVGLVRGSALDKEVWDEFAGDPQRLKQVADTIRANVGRGPLEGSDNEIDEEASEGALLSRQHWGRERSQKIVTAKKKAVLKQHGKLKCEVCEFEFMARYGERGDGFIECHHRKPLATLKPGARTKLKDLALVCANCHRMIHRRPWLTIEELRRYLRRI